MSFKAGDKVVYIGGPEPSDMIFPEKGKEVVTIKSPCMCGMCSNHYKIEEYQFDINGTKQNFHGDCLRKVEPEKKSTKASRAILKEYKELEIIEEREVIKQPIIF